MGEKKQVPFWLASPHTGRKPLYTDPETLRADCLEYLTYIHENPFYEVKAVGSEGMTISLPKMRPPTIGGLCLFLGMTQETWTQYRQKPIFSETCMEIDEAIRDWKFAGAASGFFNHAIIARDLGLVEKKAVEQRATILVHDNFADDDEDDDEA